MLIALALAAAAVLGALLALLVHPALGVAAAVALLVAGIAGHRAADRPRRAVGLGLLATVLVGGCYLAVTAVDLVQALSAADGTADQADPADLDAARAQLSSLDVPGPFRLLLTEPQLQAVVQDGLAGDAAQPLRRLELDLRPRTGDIAFVAAFKSGAVTASGVAVPRAEAGGLALGIADMEFGGVRVPGVARGSIESLLAAVTDLNGALAAVGTSVEEVELAVDPDGTDALVVTGTRAGGPVTGTTLLDAIRAGAQQPATAVTAPPEVLGPGRVDALEAPGAPIVLALGDSLTANVGVDRPRDGFVSRFHRAVEDRDQRTYGLVNLGVRGERVGTLLSGGQLDRAEAVLAERPAAYVTLDIGANDLLAHLLGDACGGDLRAAACQSAVAATLTDYRRDLGAVLDRLVTAAGDGQVVLLTTYNPFALGLGETVQEVESSAIVARLNAVAAEEAAARGVLVADGATPMAGTTAATTHMLDPVPDIHPNAAGHDVLATALYRAVGG